VRLTGLRAGEPVTFTLQPLDLRGFGGGMLGTWKADAHGTIGFSYPAGTRKWEVGRWRVVAAYTRRPSVAGALTITPHV